MKKNNLILLTSLVLSCASVTAADNKTVVETKMTSKVIKVYDGDTFTIADKDPLTNKNYRVRIKNIDTPEQGWRAKCLSEKNNAIAAQQFLSNLIFNKTVEMTHFGHDKYGRLLADVTIDGTDVGAELINKKFAASYKVHEKKPNWCQLSQLQ